MIKKIAVSIFCMLVITAGFSLSVLSEQNKEYTMTELKVSCSERMLYGNNLDDNTPTLSYVLDTLDQQQTFDSGVSYTISENGYYAQSFIPTLEQITRL